MRRVVIEFLTVTIVGCLTILASSSPLPDLDVESPATARITGSCVGLGSSVEFRESVQNPLGDSVFTQNDIYSSTGNFRDDEGYIRE